MTYNKFKNGAKTELDIIYHKNAGNMHHCTYETHWNVHWTLILIWIFSMILSYFEFIIMTKLSHLGYVGHEKAKLQLIISS